MERKINLIDFHAHILPEIDDGSQSVEESVEMLQMLSRQNVKTVVATPHFYPDMHSFDDFIFKRNVALEKLKSKLSADLPSILTGAEVAFFPGIASFERLSELQICDSKFLLIEMPMEHWRETAVRELLKMTCKSSMIPVIAHIERYIGLVDYDTLMELSANGVLLQMNCSAFIFRKTKRTAIKMMSNDMITFLGTDCHDLRERPPRMDEAQKMIVKYFGEDFLCRFTEKQDRIFKSGF